MREGKRGLGLGWGNAGFWGVRLGLGGFISTYFLLLDQLRCIEDGMLWWELHPCDARLVMHMVG